MFDDLPGQFYKALIANDRWMMYIDGLLNTLFMAGIAILLGVLIGSLVAIAKVNALYNRKNKGLRFLAAIGNIYTTVIRGTPVMVQLLILYYVIFAAVPIEWSIYVAGLAFGLNSGAYVSEIVRAGIMAVDKGQMEAGRSLGLSQSVTMKSIIFPQAIKNILPALGNEFIILFKETSIAGTIAVMDLTRAADLIRNRTYVQFAPLLLAALIYLGVVMLMTWALGKFEQKLAKSDAR